MKTNREQLLDIFLDEVNVKKVAFCITENTFLCYNGSEWFFEVNGERKEISEKNYQKIRGN